MNLAELVRFWGHWRPEHEALICGDVRQNWAELDAVTDAVAAGLAARGVRPGDRVGALLGNRPELVHVILGTLKLGAVSVPLNVRLTAGELAPLVLDADCRVVVTEEALAPALEVAAAAQPLDVVCLGGTDLPGYAELLSVGTTPPAVEIADDDAAFLCYTSGTTGVQKGAVLTHRSVLAPAEAKVVSEGLSWRDRILVAVPLVYTGAVISCFMQFTVYAGGTMVLERDFDPDRYLDMIERHRISALTTVPVLWERMAQSPDFARRDLSSLVSAAVGGAPVRLDLLETYRERGVSLVQVYGMTEASGLISALRAEDAAAYPGYAGKAIMGTAIRIAAADPADHSATAAPGEVGEILVRGAHVMREYWRNPEATAATMLPGGWLRSGDLGVMDERGYLKVVDRTKDMLISGGINVYPAEIERALAGVEGVTELAVIGVPDERWGEVPMLVVHCAGDPAPVLDRLTEKARGDLAGFKRPRFAVAAGPLPRTFSGKIAKPELRKAYPAVPADAVALRVSSAEA
ncbi:AMP-binding protein [Pseudonocardia sp. NPDC049154]|uniref:class I adenylate-forming enzyme family protein n=1 Tax=Pseudonocardia sp. NPDC049154 TaxID=3155501 RepID=UPI0033E9B404